MMNDKIGDYYDFLQTKFRFSQAHGFDVAEEDVLLLLKPATCSAISDSSQGISDSLIKSRAFMRDL